jgi:hypothetical protein
MALVAIQVLSILPILMLLVAEAVDLKVQELRLIHCKPRARLQQEVAAAHSLAQVVHGQGLLLLP